MKSMGKISQFYRLLSRNPSNIIHLGLLYRSISLLLTSFFFFLGPPDAPLLFKLGVVGALGVAAWIITDLQRRYLGNTRMLKAIVLTETIGLTLLLIPTGGISSPFIWYALNPVLVAASFLTPIFCLWALTFYLGSATLIAYYLVDIDNMVTILEEKSYFYLVCLLTTLLAKLFSGLTKELDSKAALLNVQQDELIKVNVELIETNQKYQETLEHIMSIYHLMDTISSKKSPEKLTQEITTSLITCTQRNATFFWLTDLHHQHSHLANTTNNSNMETDLKKEWNTIREKKGSFIGEISNEIYLMKVIRTSTNIGVLGVKVLGSSEVEKTFLLNRTFDFLAELSEIMLERIYMDQMMDQMIVIEEQNRIANEIHDSVSQRLFGIVYSLHSLQVKGWTSTKEELNQEYQFLLQSANATLKDLRAAIYRLSSVKKGDTPFLVRLKKYLDEYAHLNDIKIDYQITGDESLISNKLKEALYRIVCEACGNAVRHGACKMIEFNLSLEADKTVMAIQDDGIGIRSNYGMGKAEQGIGLSNIQSSVSSFDGTFSIEGIQGIGTTIRIEIPNKQEGAGL